MNWDLLFCIYLGLCFGSYAIAAYLYYKENDSAGRGARKKIAAFVIAGSIIISFPYVCYLRDLGKWKTKSFNGVIVNKVKTTHHALYEFTINDDVHGEVKILDEFGKMDRYKIGDKVRKQKGEEVVRQLK